MGLDPLLGEPTAQGDDRADPVGDEVDDVERRQPAVRLDERLRPGPTIGDPREVVPVPGVFVGAQRREPAQRVRDIVRRGPGWR
ncbi:MAG: hypothetical protein JWN22_1400 [Nocardioides sp.]|nr:hypothetical protein [Nocardioides sp.]